MARVSGSSARRNHPAVNNYLTPVMPISATERPTGVSRTSKTLSIYLANRGIRTANGPLVPGIPVPHQPEKLTRTLVVSLHATPDRLIQVRQNWLLTMGAGSTTLAAGAPSPRSSSPSRPRRDRRTTAVGRTCPPSSCSTLIHVPRQASCRNRCRLHTRRNCGETARRFYCRN